MPSAVLEFSDGHYAWEDVNPRQAAADYLAQGWQVGIGMWPLYSNGVHYGGHALTVQEIGPQADWPFGTFTVTDSDRDHDWTSIGDLNTYADYNYGPVDYNGHTYYPWFNDFYSDDLNSWPDGDVGYLVAVIPEPATVTMFVICGFSMLRRRRG